MINLKMNRTPTLREFRKLRNDLDSLVSEIHEAVPFQRLEFESMTRVLQYLSENYSEEKTGCDERPYYNESLRIVYGKPMYYDIGHHLIKEEIQRTLEEQGKDTAEVSLLLDGILGWIYYNSGKVHDREQDRALEKYVEGYGIRRFRKNFREVEGLFEQLHEVAHSAEHFNGDRIRREGLKQADYITFFQQSKITVSYDKQFNPYLRKLLGLKN